MPDRASVLSTQVPCNDPKTARRSLPAVAGIRRGNRRLASRPGTGACRWRGSGLQSGWRPLLLHACDCCHRLATSVASRPNLAITIDWSTYEGKQVSVNLISQARKGRE